MNTLRKRLGASTTNEGIVCVHPVQTWLDLNAHEELAEAVARELRSEYLAMESR